MKKIEAIIRKSRFEDVKKALLEADIEWFSYYDVRGNGKARQGRIYRGIVYDTSSIERTLVSLVVRDKNVEKSVQAILKAQSSREDRLNHADDVLVNDKDLAWLHGEVERLHHFYLTLRGGRS